MFYQGNDSMPSQIDNGCIPVTHKPRMGDKDDDLLLGKLLFPYCIDANSYPQLSSALFKMATHLCITPFLHRFPTKSARHSQKTKLALLPKVR